MLLLMFFYILNKVELLHMQKGLAHCLRNYRKWVLSLDTDVIRRKEKKLLKNEERTYVQ